MLPQASNKQRNAPQQQLTSGRTKEISRIVGRALRAVVDLESIGPNTIIIDCDVLQADGGTRTASINGGFIAMYDLFNSLIKQGQLKENPIKKFLGSISVGIVHRKQVVDLCQEEDNNAEVDATVVMTEDKELIELQYTAEKGLYKLKLLNQLVELAWQNIIKIISLEKKLLSSNKKTIYLK
jgi:ribonuclease PH